MLWCLSVPNPNSGLILKIHTSIISEKSQERNQINRNESRVKSSFLKRKGKKFYPINPSKCKIL